MSEAGMPLVSAEKAVRVSVRGRVQGVWFRAWTTEEASRRGLRGWVRNRRDGSVEALFAGTATAVDEMVAACRQGPPLAKVEAVEQAPAGDVDGDEFRQLPTA